MNAPEPMTPLTENANVLHEVFETYVAAGFTEQQALYLVGQVLVAMVTRGDAS